MEQVTEERRLNLKAIGCSLHSCLILLPDHELFFIYQHAHSDSESLEELEPKAWTMLHQFIHGVSTSLQLKPTPEGERKAPLIGEHKMLHLHPLIFFESKSTDLITAPS